MLGVLVGVWALSVIHPGVLLLVHAGVFAAYIALFLSQPTLEMTQAGGRFLSPPAGLGTGALQGPTGVSGPLLTAYTHALRLTRRAFVFQLAAQIQVFAVVQVIGFVVVGLYTSDRVGASLLAIVPAVAGLPVGMTLSSRLPRRGFELLVLVFLAAMAVKLIVDGLGQL